MDGSTLTYLRVLAVVLGVILLVDIAVAVATRSLTTALVSLVSVPVIVASVVVTTLRNWVDAGPVGVAASLNGTVSMLPRDQIDRALWIEYQVPMQGVQPTLVVLGRMPGTFVRVHPGVLSSQSAKAVLQAAAIHVERVPGVWTPAQFNQQFPMFTTARERQLPALRRVSIGIIVGAALLLVPAIFVLVVAVMS